MHRSPPAIGLGCNIEPRRSGRHNCWPAPSRPIQPAATLPARSFSCPSPKGNLQKKGNCREPDDLSELRFQLLDAGALALSAFLPLDHVRQGLIRLAIVSALPVESDVIGLDARRHLVFYFFLLLL